MALIEAEGAEGASIISAPGVRVNRGGYALAPYVRPYRINNIEIDLKAVLKISCSKTHQAKSFLMKAVLLR